MDASPSGKKLSAGGYANKKAAPSFTKGGYLNKGLGPKRTGANIK